MPAPVWVTVAYPWPPTALTEHSFMVQPMIDPYHSNPLTVLPPDRFVPLTVMLLMIWLPDAAA